MEALLSRTILDAILAESRAAGDEECCGLLLGGTDGRVEAIRPAANVAANRRRRFEIDPAVLIAAYRAERSGGPRILGCYHSHPGGSPIPSGEDERQAAGNGWLWLICASDEVRGWRATAKGFVAAAVGH